MKKTQKMNAIISNLPPKEILRQSTEAVNFIHSKDIIHRNLHPGNFLVVCVDPNNDNFVIKLTDFQHSKKWKTASYDLSSVLANEGWAAPESLLEELQKQSMPNSMLDVFILGIYYYYVLSGGKHPFGESAMDQMDGIRNKNNPIYEDTWTGGANWQNVLLNNDVRPSYINLLSIRSIAKK